MASLNISKMVLDKDSWENIPPMVFKSFQTTNANMNGIQKWAEFYEARAKSQTEFLNKLEEKLTLLEQSLNTLQERTVQGEQNLAAESQTVRHQALSCAVTFQRMERCMALVFHQLGETFGVAAPAVTAVEAVEVAEVAEGEDSLSMMQNAVLSLENELDTVKTAFQRWRESQAQDQERYAAVQSSIEDLQNISGESSEKISGCQSLLEEHSRANESTSETLAETQAAVRELHSSRVQHEDVETAVQRKGEELEFMRRLTDQSVDRLGKRIEDHVTEVQRLVSDLGRQTEDKLEDYSNQVARMVEGHMNPLNAYLNTMHVKSDVMRLDVDKLQEQAPQLSSSIEEAMQKLAAMEQAHGEQSAEMSGWLEQMRSDMAENMDRHDGQHGQLSKSMQEMLEELNARLQQMQDFSEKTCESLETVKREDLSGLARELLILDQKVAKWVHSNPLPAKISEARLYSLEARLADEMDARIAFECKVRKGMQITPRVTEDMELVLPQISQESFGGRGSVRRRLAADH